MSSEHGWPPEHADLPLLQAGAASLLGLALTPEQIQLFARYYQELVDWNQRANLTAITDPAEVQTKHFLDSLSSLLAFPPEVCTPSNETRRRNRRWRLMDVGSGAGFPGLPLKIVCPTLQVTCLDSVGKKTAFVAHLVEALGLEGVQVVTGRAEDLAHRPEHRQRYDLVVSRAVADLRVLAEYCLPFARVGGWFIAFKGQGIEDEIEAARPAMGQLGGKLRRQIPVDLPGLEGQHQLIVVEKVRPTPSSFPRRAGTPRQRPL